MVGIDPSLSVIEHATLMTGKLNCEHFIQFREGAFEDIPFPDETFDIVISNASFNLFIEKERAIYEMSRVAKSGGKVIIADCFKKLGVQFKESNICGKKTDFGRFVY